MNQKVFNFIALMSLILSLIAGTFAYRAWNTNRFYSEISDPSNSGTTTTTTSPTTMTPRDGTTATATMTQESSSGDLVSALNERLITIAARVKPAVVTVFIEKVWKERVFDPFAGFDSFFDDFFFGGRGPRQPRQQQPEEREFRSQGLGSGVITSKDGFILTNNHVVADADTIQVNLFDRRIRKAKVIGKDPKTDLAVIKIDEDNLPFIAQGDSAKIRVGEIVLAVGSPMSPGLAHTVTQGIVSAVGRSNVGLADYEDFIQTDAAINPGNSGGALVNLNGELMGVNSAIVSQSGGSQGIGFAIPVNMAKTVMASLIKTGKVTRAWAGISTQDITEELAQGLHLKTQEGVLISDLDPNGPAATAGVQRGDVVTEMNGEKVLSSPQFRNRVAETTPGEKISLKILRNEKEFTKEVLLKELPTQNQQQQQGNDPTARRPLQRRR